MSSSNQEIERKFLVIKLPPDLNQFPHDVILQGYLAVAADGTEVRLRKRSGKYYQTVKIGTGFMRKEIEIALMPEQFQKLWPLTTGKRIKKIRYKMAYENHLIEIDVFQNDLKGLLLAEVEFNSLTEMQTFIPPDWFGAEVTTDKHYKNQSLAIYGIPLK